jgi:hypothetical protein
MALRYEMERIQCKLGRCVDQRHSSCCCLLRWRIQECNKMYSSQKCRKQRPICVGNAASFKGTSNISCSKEDPLVPFNPWQLHNPCPVPAANTTPPLSQCKIASYPAYVVAASTVRDVQLAVNFARNNHIRLTIKYYSLALTYVALG